MLLSDHDQTPRQRSTIQPRRKGPPPSLRIDAPPQKPPLTVVLADSTSASSSLSSANSESDISPQIPKPLPSKARTMRNTKKLSLTLPSVHATRSSNSLSLFSDGDGGHATDDSTRAVSAFEPRRRASLASFQNVSLASRLHRKDEDESPQSPYADGPVEILPGVWLGNEDNATNWKGLADRGIRAILNVAREVISPFDTAALSRSASVAGDAQETFYPAHGARPAMHYLKLAWSHGQPDLVKDGFVTAMAYVDSALQRGDGVLVHCQCGVSRSATVVIGLVMRAAAQSSSSTPTQVQALKGAGFSGAYDFVKSKSPCIGPNMLLIYQLQDYQQVLNGVTKSPSESEHSSVTGESDEEWSRRRRMLDDEPEPDVDRESVEVLQEAYALDRAMEERVVARKASGSSLGSSTGIGMGPAWKAKYGSRKRAGSIASNLTSISIISEDLVEEDEKEELLGIGGGFDAPSISSRSHSGETTEEEVNASPEAKKDRHVPALSAFTPTTAKPAFFGKRRLPDSLSRLPPPSAPATKTSFDMSARQPFRPRPKLRPPPLNFLPPVPSSPDVLDPSGPSTPPEPVSKPDPPPRRRPIPPPLRLAESAFSSQHPDPARAPDPEIRRPALAPLQSSSRLGSFTSRSSSRSSSQSQVSYLSVTTPSQTLFVFPPSPTLKAHHTPHMVTVTSSLNNVLSPFAGAPTPRVSTFKKEGRRKSFIGLTVPPTPTTACSRVDARGWVGVGAWDL